jgi:ArsR family transcriptional regulator
MVNPAPLHDLSVACCRALSDDTRIRILEALVGKETCVCELVDRLDVAQPLLSHHLKTLREAGLVRAEKRGRWMFYSIDADALEQTAAALSKLARAQRSAGTRLEVCCG